MKANKTFSVEVGTLNSLEQIAERDNVPLSELVDRLLTKYVNKRGEE